MANAIVRNVVVAKFSSKTNNEENRNSEINIDNECTTISKEISETTHRVVDAVCKCTCHLTNPLNQPLPSNSQKTNSNSVDAANSESLDDHNLFINCKQCAKLKCSSLKLNISPSTSFKNKFSEATNDENIFTPTHDNLNNCRSLGKLLKKRSPLFGPCQGTSLRSEKTLYTQNILQADKINQLNSTATKYNGNIIHTATEALSMNGGKQLNGPSGALPKSNWSDVSRNGAPKNSNWSDVSRNGAPKNSTIMTTANTEKREHLYKILVIGELGTGKTSFIKRYVHQFFSQNYRATIGVDFALKVLHWDPNTIVRLQLWDIAGQERFGNMTRVYYKEAVGAFIVFDVTRSGTFDCVSKWKEDLDSKVQLPDGSPIPCILLANKCDQDKQGVVTNSEKMDEYVKEHGFAGWFETSAKENINIDEAARALVNKILLNDKLISAADLADSEKFNLNNSADPNAMDGKSKCSC